MSPPQVLITDYAWPALDVERPILEPLGATLLVAERGDAENTRARFIVCWQW